MAGDLRGRIPGPPIVAPAGRFPRVAAREIAARMRRASERGPAPGTDAPTGGRISLALAGGSTPRPVYEALAEIPDLPWEEVEIFFGDERAVPPDDPASNFGMARASLLERIPLPDRRVHRIEAEAEDREAAARRYHAVLPDAIDVLLLGVGHDGHTASLFPGYSALSEEEAKVMVVEGPDEPHIRLTVTPPVIRSARRIVVLVRGEEKAEAVARALGGPRDPAACPAVLARGGTWVLDPEAASLLPEREEVR